MLVIGSAIIAVYQFTEEAPQPAYIYTSEALETLSEAQFCPVSEVIPEKVETPTLCQPQCVAWVRSKIPDLPRMPSPNHLDERNRPSRGCAVLFDYDHIAFIEGLFVGGMWVSETNRDGKCSKAERLVEWTDPHIAGFWCPERP